MKWCEPTLKPSEGQEIVLRAKKENGRYAYAIGQWIKDRFIMVDTGCPHCGSVQVFMPPFSDFFRHVTTSWQWLPLSKFLELERRLDHAEFEKDRMYDRVLRAEEVMYEAVINGNDNELIDYVNEGLSKL